MPKKKTELEPLVSAAAPEKAAVKKTRKTTAKDEAPKTAASAKPRTKAVTHKHKKQEAAGPAMNAAAWTAETIHQEISRIAYGYYEARGYQPGSPDEDWARAEREFWSRFQA